MRKLLATLGLLVAATVGVTVASTATATPPALALCSGWYVNPSDELDRAPEQKSDGLLFEATDLVHRAVTGVTVAALTPGTYVAAPAPDQPSFFSVEVGEPGTYAGYATLRWNPGTSKWTMVTGGTAYEDASPAALVAKTTPAKSSNVLSFGVGYTKNPPGTVATKVSSVTFQGQTYLTYCLPSTSSSSSPAASASSSSKPASATPTGSASASASASATTSPSGSASATPSSTPIVTRPVGGLPLTGAPLIAIGGAGVLLVLAGGAALFFLKRRDDDLQA